MTDLSFEKLSRPYKFFSRAVALLPFEGRDFDFVGTRLLTVLMLLSTFIAAGMLTGYVIDALVTGRPLKAEDLYITIMALGGFFRYYIYMWLRKDKAALFEECAQLWQFCNAKGREAVKRYENKIRIFGGILLSNCFMTNVILPINAYMKRLPSFEPNGTERRVLPYVWFVEDEPYQFLGYHATFIIQSIAVQNCLLTGLVCDSAIPGFVMLGAGYFHQLQDRLADCCEDDASTHGTEVIHCIKYHQKLLEYCNKLEKFSRIILLAQIVTSCYSISLVLLKLVSSDPEKYNHVGIMGICMCQLFVVQWTPDQLADESESVAFAVYSVLMKRLDDKFICRNLHIMLARAQVPVCLMAGGFVILSLEKYASMMNGAFSFFMVLRTFEIQ